MQRAPAPEIAKTTLPRFICTRRPCTLCISCIASTADTSCIACTSGGGEGRGRAAWRGAARRGAARRGVAWRGAARRCAPLVPTCNLRTRTPLGSPCTPARAQGVACRAAVATAGFGSAQLPIGRGQLPGASSYSNRGRLARRRMRAPAAERVQRSGVMRWAAGDRWPAHALAARPGTGR